MHFTVPILFALSVITLSLSLRPVIKRLHIPFVLCLVVIGYVASESFVAMGFDTGIRAGNFHEFIDFLFIPALIFASANEFRAHFSPRVVLNISALTVFIGVSTFFLTAVGIYYGIGHPSGFPWHAAVLTAAALLAVDAHSVKELLHDNPVMKKHDFMIHGEGLLSEVIAVVVFMLCLEFAKMPTDSFSVLHLFVHLAKYIIGGILFGLGIGAGTVLLIKSNKDPIIQGLFSLLSVYITFFLSEDIAECSGIVSVFVLGLIVGNRKHYADENGYIERLWDMLALMANSCIYLLVGVTTTLTMFKERWLAMLIAIAAVVIARYVAVHSAFGLLGKIKLMPRAPFQERNAIVLVGVRGALSLALVFSIPTSLSYWWTIQSIAFGVVLFGLLVQTGFLKFHCYKLSKH